jgi:hypothetical protein
MTPAVAKRRKRRPKFPPIVPPTAGERVGTHRHGRVQIGRVIGQQDEFSTVAFEDEGVGICVRRTDTLWKVGEKSGATK